MCAPRASEPSATVLRTAKHHKHHHHLPLHHLPTAPSSAEDRAGCSLTFGLPSSITLDPQRPPSAGCNRLQAPPSRLLQAYCHPGQVQPRQATCPRRHHQPPPLLPLGPTKGPQPSLDDPSRRCGQRRELNPSSNPHELGLSPSLVGLTLLLWVLPPPSCRRPSLAPLPQ